ncbi:MAG: hypothetical protein HZA91_13470 [Verrucomicrobia bacterium]|nr:hypothetical protein [Verrucomicrobiota bacterium]
MQLRYDGHLLESVVFLEARRLEQSGQAALAGRYHAQRSTLYELADPDQRSDGFFKLHVQWFRELGLEARVLATAKEFPLIEERATSLMLRKALAKKEEGAELFVRPGAKNVVVALRSERFLEDGFEPFLRHEFCHVADMLDDAFGYEPRIELAGAPPTELALLRDRYRVLWDITIAGRLKQEAERAACWSEFTRAFSTLPEERQRELFDRLWRERPAHAGLLDIAKSSHTRAARTPGGACPLCKFPTFDWAGADGLGSGAVAAIQEHFPNWRPEDGCCGRCAELYAMSKMAQPPTLFV